MTSGPSSSQQAVVSLPGTMRVQVHQSVADMSLRPGAQQVGDQGSSLQAGRMAAVVAAVPNQAAMLPESLRVLHHHERWNGTDSPDGTPAAAIPLRAGLVAGADVYDALRLARPSKDAWPEASARPRLPAPRGRDPPGPSSGSSWRRPPHRSGSARRLGTRA